MKNINNKKFNSFNFEIEKPSDSKTSSPSTDRGGNDELGHFKMREWQLEAFQHLQNASYMILNAPTGSGKSSIICYIAAIRMHQEPSRKCIISVPQEMIGPGFSVLKHPVFQMPDGTIYKWDIANNLCLSTSHKSDQVIKWLQKTGGSLAERTLLCTHATLVSVFKKLKTMGKEDLLRHLLIWIDEAHHLMNAHAEESTRLISNGIGGLVHFVLANRANNIHLGLATATFIRGDRYTLLTPTMEEQFCRFYLPYDKYLQSCKHLKSFSYNFVICGYDYINGIEMIIKQKKCKDIIYIPPTTSRYSLKDKYVETRRIIEKYAQLYGRNGQTVQGDLIILNDSNGDFKILDLVEDDYKHRRSRKAYMSKLKKTPKEVDAVIAMSMFKEGADWECADRCIIVGPKGSLTDLIQMIGRLLRDFPGKEHVEVIHLLPFTVGQQKSDLRENLNNVLKAILCSMLLEEVLKPIQIKGTVSQTVVGDKIKNKQQCSQPLTELIPNSEIRIAVLNDLSLYYLELCEKYESSRDALSYEEFQVGVPALLQKYQIENNAKEIGDRAWAMVHRLYPSVMRSSLDVENIKFNAIKDVYPLESLLMYLGEVCGVTTFSELRKAIDASKSPLSEEEIISWTQQHLTKYGKKPAQKNIFVEFAQGNHQGITWTDIDNSLKRGLRGLPGGDTLPAFIERKFGIEGRKMSTLPISIALARSWIRQYVDKYDEKPTKRSKVIEFAEGEHQGLTWGALDSALRRGSRSLPKSPGLADLVEEECGIKNPRSVPVLSEEEILDHVRTFRGKHSRKPHCNDGNIEGVDSLTWANIDGHLRQRESSLSRFIEEKLGIRARNTSKNLSLSLIQDWIVKYFEKHEKAPKALSQSKVEFAEGIHKGITWGTVHSEIKKGRCELPIGAGLADVVAMTLDRSSKV